MDAPHLVAGSLLRSFPLAVMLFACAGATSPRIDATDAHAVYEKGWRDGAEVACLDTLGTLAAAERKAAEGFDERIKVDAEIRAGQFERFKTKCHDQVDWLWNLMSKE